MLNLVSPHEVSIKTGIKSDSGKHTKQVSHVATVGLASTVVQVSCRRIPRRRPECPLARASWCGECRWSFLPCSSPYVCNTCLILSYQIHATNREQQQWILGDAGFLLDRRKEERISPTMLLESQVIISLTVRLSSSHAGVVGQFLSRLERLAGKGNPARLGRGLFFVSISILFG